MNKLWLVSVAFLIIITACNSNPKGLNVELDDGCDPEGGKIKFEGLYRSERHGEADDVYYSWNFIRFFEDCTYLSISSTQENAAHVASVGFLGTHKDQKNGRYSVEGTTIKMTSDINEFIGAIEGSTLALDFYVFEKKKTGSDTYEYIHVNAIRDDIFSTTGEQKLAPAP